MNHLVDLVEKDTNHDDIGGDQNSAYQQYEGSKRLKRQRERKPRGMSSSTTRSSVIISRKTPAEIHGKHHKKDYIEVT